MSLYTSMPELNPPKLSKSLLLFSTIEFIVGIVLSVIEFLTLFTIGAVLAVSTGSAGAVGKHCSSEGGRTTAFATATAGVVV